MSQAIKPDSKNTNSNYPDGLVAGLGEALEKGTKSPQAKKTTEREIGLRKKQDTSQDGDTKKLLKSAVQQNKLGKKDGILEKLFRTWFDGFVYNQIWEDPDVDVQALGLKDGDRVLTIASGGCNVLNYLCHSDCQIQAVDLNRYHMSLLRLKIAAIKGLDNWQDFYDFFAVGNNPKNIYNYYRFISPELDKDSRAFWEGKGSLRNLLGLAPINYFKKNIYNYSRSGYYLRFLHAVSKFTKGDLTKVLAAGSMKEQEELFNKHISPSFDHWVVKSLGKLPVTFYSLGIPPQQYKCMADEGGEGIIDLFRERIRRLACDFSVDDNYFVWQAFGRQYKKDCGICLPPYLKQENFEKLKARVTNISTQIVSTTQFLGNQIAEAENKQSAPFNAFVFLDSQDWMSSEQVTELWSNVSNTSAPKARVIFRTSAQGSIVEELLDEPIRAKFEYLTETSKNLHAEDRSAVYGGFHIYEKI